MEELLVSKGFELSGELWEIEFVKMSDIESVQSIFGIENTCNYLVLQYNKATDECIICSDDDAWEISKEEFIGCVKRM